MPLKAIISLLITLSIVSAVNFEVNLFKEASSYMQTSDEYSDAVEAASAPDMEGNFDEQVKTLRVLLDKETLLTSDERVALGEAYRGAIAERMGASNQDEITELGTNLLVKLSKI